MTKILGQIQLPEMDGLEIKPGIILIGEPIPIEGSTKLRCLAKVFGCLAIIEFSIKFEEING